MLSHFEEFDGYTKRAGAKIQWFLLELYKHDIDHPITARSIKTMTRRTHYEELSREQKMNNIRAKEIIDHPGLAGTEVRTMVNFLRGEGYPIGSRGSGYYWCRSQEDVQVTLDHLDGRLFSIQRARDGMAQTDLDKSASNTLHLGLFTKESKTGSMF